MYSAPYGFANAAGPPFNGAPPPQNAHLQPGPSPNQAQMMYNPQQFPMGAQGPFPGGPNPNMMPGAGPAAGMMQNAAMPPNGQMAYQTPYTSSPYGPGVPSPAGGQAQMPPNYMMAGPMAGYPMNTAGGMPPQQQMMPRMHPSQQQSPAGMAVSTPQRPFAHGQGTPNNAMPSQQAQFSPPQAQPNSSQAQTPSNAQQPVTSATTPQTPTFPSTGQGAAVNGASSVSTPLSPGTESKEKERFALLLEINQELLYESIQLQNTKAELKKEVGSTSADGANKTQEPESSEEKLIQQDYAHCMRRLHANLAYLAALADRRGNVQVPPCPAYLMPPPLNPNIKMKGQNPVPEAKEKQIDPNADREERDRLIRDLYARLQALFPGIDPKKEPVSTAPAGGPGTQGQHAGGGPGQIAQRPAGAGPGSIQASPGPGQAHGQKTQQLGMSAAAQGQTQAIKS